MARGGRGWTWGGWPARGPRRNNFVNARPPPRRRATADSLSRATAYLRIWQEAFWNAVYIVTSHRGAHIHAHRRGRRGPACTTLLVPPQYRHSMYNTYVRARARACVCVCVCVNTATPTTTSASPIGSFERRCARPLSSLPRPLWSPSATNPDFRRSTVPRYRATFCRARNPGNPAAEQSGQGSAWESLAWSTTMDFLLRVGIDGRRFKIEYSTAKLMLELLTCLGDLHPEALKIPLN